MTIAILPVEDTSFKAEVLEAKLPVLVDFWAPWCGPCKMLAPLLEELAIEYADKLRIVKLNTDNNKDAAANFAVRGLPTLMLFKDGQVIATQVGMALKSELQAFIDSNIFQIVILHIIFKKHLGKKNDIISSYF
ncbi:MAG: thioredoxin [Legionellales bacterium]|nr:MAG: thioredoxin [Legionellales bacterium]